MVNNSKPVATTRVLLALFVLTFVPALLNAQSDTSAHARAFLSTEAYRWHILVATLVVMIAQGALIAALLTNRARR